MENMELDAAKLVEELFDEELLDEEEGLLGDDEKLGIEDELLEALLDDELGAAVIGV
jgi:hypothetical protein